MTKLHLVVLVWLVGPGCFWATTKSEGEALGPDYRVAIDTDFLTEARTLLGADAIL